MSGRRFEGLRVLWGYFDNRLRFWANRRREYRSVPVPSYLLGLAVDDMIASPSKVLRNAKAKRRSIWEEAAPTFEIHADGDTITRPAYEACLYLIGGSSAKDVCVVGRRRVCGHALLCVEKGGFVRRIEKLVEIGDQATVDAGSSLCESYDRSWDLLAGVWRSLPAGQLLGSKLNHLAGV